MSGSSLPLPQSCRVSIASGEEAGALSVRFSIHYGRHFPAVRRYAFAILRCRYEAEDVAQEAFVRLLKTLEHDTEPEVALPWLLRVTHNLALTRVARQQPVGLDVVHEDRLADPTPNPEEAVVARQREQWVQEALALLSAQELRCWTLRAEGLRYREIAEILSIRTGTVATLLVRAADKLSAATRKAEAVR